MKLIGRIEIDGVTDVICDICGGSTTIKDDYPPEFATLKAAWGYPSKHDGKSYELDFCEDCFFQTLANLKEQRRQALIFSEQGYTPDPDFGLSNQGAVVHYPVIIERDGDTWMARFPDVPEALTCGDSREEALTAALDALVTAFEFYIENGRPVPVPSSPIAGQELVSVPLSLLPK
ncbi:type II toxin-antitoxin system HicB family antitoxin [Aeromonas hydrophila]|jgi:predicted RNase H-like HicB family nuclease|uniref:type II toxin-antitoxin system HicB family antitoxin n=1 Tax=Aeromonas hydrophila TaxID=644 RepID=UPI00301AA929